MGKKKTAKARVRNTDQTFSNGGGESLPPSVEGIVEVPPGIAVSMFDCSVENHFRAVDLISTLCGEEGEFDHTEIQRLKSSITFLREWIHFNYQPKIVRFSCQTESLQGKDVSGGIKLPQFSASTVPKKDRQNGTTISPESSKDFIMHVGGSVWALDWCPRVRQSSDCDITSEFIAVSAHPPDSSYHKMGAPLIGRGVVQIWCLVTVGAKEEGSQLKKKPKRKPRSSSDKPIGRPRKHPIVEKSEKPKGRPRKHSMIESVDNLDGDNQNMLTLADPLPNDDSSRLVPTEESVAKKDTGKKRKSSEPNSTQPKKPRGRPKKNQCEQDLAVLLKEDSSKLLSIEPGNIDVTKDRSTQPQKQRGRGRKNPINESIDELDSIEATKDKLTQTKKPRGRTRKKPINESTDELDSSNQCEQVLAVQFPEDSSKLLSVEPGNSEATKDKSTRPKKPRGPSKKKPINESVDDLDSNDEYVQALAIQVPEDSSELLPIDAISKDTYPCESQDFPGTGVPSLTENENIESTLVPEISSSCNQDPVGSSLEIANGGSLEASPAKCSIPKDVALPRAVLCLAHNGKVAWDVKWRPCDVRDTGSKHRMGFLAVLLGNGALEVWEVPSLRALKVIYSACQKEGTDPRFIKLEPVFRCSMLRSGDRLSIPLTLEWSASTPHDLILAGCHDGVVALWKFTANRPSEDTRPLLCFSADTVPIRALAWAPVPSDPESANVFVTAGHKGLKFWDMRDPSRPLWDLNPTQRIIYSLDWLPEPRCIIVAFDDGTLRILSMSKGANDVPVTGKPFGGTAHQGLNSYYCSPFTIWSVQVSRLTGMVAYCSADGTALRFELTIRAVEKDPLRNRAPHFLCGSLTEEDSILTVNTPLPDTPFPMKKSMNEWSNAPRTIRGFVAVTNQEKRAKEAQMAKAPKLDEHALALCDADDPTNEFGSNDMVVMEKSKKAPKTKGSTKKKLKKGGQELVCRDDDDDEEEEEEGNEQKEESEKGDVEKEIDVFPPKVVAMHRVRWNMNKGSERWLCFGGAAGIVRCQYIDKSDVW